MYTYLCIYLYVYIHTFIIYMCIYIYIYLFICLYCSSVLGLQLLLRGAFELSVPSLDFDAPLWPARRPLGVDPKIRSSPDTKNKGLWYGMV